MPRLPAKTEGTESGGAVGIERAHLTTDHLLPNLKGRTISSALVTTATQSIKFALNLIFTVIMARLLMPEDFGLVAIPVAVIASLHAFKDVGLSTATVQREDITHAQVSNLFWINLGISGLISLLLVATAPGLAWFYREPRLLRVTVLLSITFLLSGPAVQHQALLNRQMRFKAVSFIEVGALAVGYFTGFAMAERGWRHWSLVGSMLSLEAARLLLTWSAARWRPQFPTRHSRLRPLLNFGANLTAASFIHALARGSDTLLIGRFFGPDLVGLYSRASVLITRPLDDLLATLSAVFVAALSRLQTQPERYRRTFLHVYEAIAVTTFTVSAVCLPLAHPLILVILGPNWESAAGIFGALILTALFLPFKNLSTWLFASQGRGKHWFLTISAVSCLTVASFLAGLPFGPAGVAISYAIVGLVILLPLVYYIAGREGPVSTKDLWLGFLRHLPVWGVVYGTTYLTRTHVLASAPLAQVFICAPIGLGAGAAFVSIFSPSRRIVLSLFSLVQELNREHTPPSA